MPRHPGCSTIHTAGGTDHVCVLEHGHQRPAASALLTSSAILGSDQTPVATPILH